MENTIVMDYIPLEKIVEKVEVVEKPLMNVNYTNLTLKEKAQLNKKLKFKYNKVEFLTFDNKIVIIDYREEDNKGCWIACSIRTGGNQDQ